MDETNIPENITKLKTDDLQKHIPEVRLKNITVYKYYEIELTSNYSYVEDKDFKSVEINFTVEKTWKINNSIDLSTINVMRYHQNQWQKLNTTIIKEDEEHYYFKAESPGFSTFAVVGGNIIEPTLGAEEPDPPWTIIIGFIISALIILIVILFKFGYIYIEREETPDFEE